jgi:hypothetical protein
MRREKGRLTKEAEHDLRPLEVMGKVSRELDRGENACGKWVSDAKGALDLGVGGRHLEAS